MRTWWSNHSPHLLPHLWRFPHWRGSGAGKRARSTTWATIPLSTLSKNWTCSWSSRGCDRCQLCGGWWGGFTSIQLNTRATWAGDWPALFGCLTEVTPQSCSQPGLEDNQQPADVKTSLCLLNSVLRQGFRATLKKTHWGRFLLVSRLK